MSRLFAFAGALVAVLLAAGPARAQDDAPAIAVAASVQFAVEEAAAAFTAQTGMRVRLAFGSSGNFFRQIMEGAPFQMFLSADEAMVRALEQAGRTEGAGDLYAAGRIVLMVPHGSTLQADATLEDLERALSDGRLSRFAIANPEHAPYGQAAQQALSQRGIWEAIQPHLVIGENVAQAAQFATSGNSEGGLIAYSLAISPGVAARGDFALIPQEWHKPLLQRMVLLANAGETARAFYGFLQSPEGRAILDRHGFTAPQDGN